MQGMVGGALASALNIDEEINAYFEDSPVEISYSSTRLQPVSFQDDILRVCDDRDASTDWKQYSRVNCSTSTLKSHILWCLEIAKQRK
jgi:hypothetical protein